MSKPEKTAKAPAVATPPETPPAVAASATTTPAAAPAPEITTVAPAPVVQAAAADSSPTPPPPESGSPAAPATEVEKPLDTDPKPVRFTAEDHAHAAKQREAKVFEEQLRHLRRAYPVVEKLCQKMEQLELELAALKKN